MDLGEPTVRTLNEIVLAFKPEMVIWLLVLLALEFITGVILAFQKNQFDWDKIYDVAKKNILIAAGWGAAFLYSENAGNVVYALALAAVGGGVVANVTALLGANIGGLGGQLVTKGPGDGGDTSGNTARPVQINATPPVEGQPIPKG